MARTEFSQLRSSSVGQETMIYSCVGLIEPFEAKNTFTYVQQKFTMISAIYVTFQIVEIAGVLTRENN